MTTALATLSSNGTALTAAQQAVLAELESEKKGGYDYLPTRIKFPSGGMSVFSVDGDDVLKPPVRAIIAVSQKARAWWPDKETQGQPPLCQSPDGVVGIFNTEADYTAALAYPTQHPGLEPDAGALFQCATCPLAQWGSAGKGQACKSLRRLIVLVDGWSMPAVMTLPPTSVKVFDQYASARARTVGGAYFTAYTKIELVQNVNDAGIKYSVAKFTVDSALSDAQIGAVIEIRRQYAELVRTLDIGGDDYDTGSASSNDHNAPDDEEHPF